MNFPKPQLFLSSRQNAELDQYRDWAAEEVERFSTLVSMWRFEGNPASTRSPEDLYTEGVLNAAAVLFIAGSDTSEATAGEISSAVESRKDILALILPPVTPRTARVQHLIDRIRPYATTKDVPGDEAGFREAVRAAVQEWLIQRVAGAPLHSRIAKLDTLRNGSLIRLQQSWMAAGLPPELAADFARDDKIGEPAGFVQLDETALLQVLVGPKGSGKTLTLERLYQKAIHAAQADVLAPVPIFVRAPDVAHALLDSVQRATSGLGSLELNGIVLFLDSLDEVDESRAERLLQDAWNLVHTYGGSRAVVAGRHSAPKHLRAYEVKQPELAPRTARALVERIGGENALRLLRDASDAVASALRRPLFAIVLATTDPASVDSATEKSIADQLIDNGLSRAERRAIATAVLQRLAVQILDADAAAVPVAAFSGEEQEQLLATRLVVEDAGLFRIPIRLIAETAAGQWLLGQGRVQVMARIEGAGARADRWESAIRQYLARLGDVEAEHMVLDIARHDLTYALSLAKADSSERSSPWTADEYRSETEASDARFASALPRLYAANHSDIAVNVTGQFLQVQRDVLDERGRLDLSVTYLRDVRETRHGPLLLAKEFAVKLVDDALEHRTLLVQNPVVAEETFWNHARLILGRGSLAHQPLEIREVLDRLDDLPGEPFFLGGDGARHFRIDPVALRRHLEIMLAAGTEHYPPPFVPGDKPYSKWVWSAYSVDRLLGKRRSTVVAAMEIYKEIVDSWFPGLALHLRRYLLMPALYRENIRYDGENEPVYSEYWMPLPQGSANEVEIALGEPFDFFELSGSLGELVDNRRATTRQRIPITATTGLLHMWTPWPARDLAYSWVLNDLKALGFTKHLRLPHGD